MMDKKKQELGKELGERIKDVTAKVVAGLREAGREVETAPRTTLVGGVEFEDIRKVDGIDPALRITAQRSGGRSAWGIHYNGKLTMSLGGYPDTKSFPEPKAGFDIAKTVERIQEHVACKHANAAAERARQEAIKATKSVADQVQETMDKYLGPSGAIVSHTRPGNYRFNRPETARVLPAVTIEMDLLEAQAVAALLGSMRKGKNVVAEAEAYGDEGGQAGAESGVEHEEV